MATIPISPQSFDADDLSEYSTGDGKPLAETPIHRDNLLQGYRLRGGVYIPIESVDGRLPSEQLGLELERDGEWLKYYAPARGRWLPSPQERLLEKEAARERAVAQRERLAAELRSSAGELECLRQELAQWRSRSGAPPTDKP